jgi:RNA polymerase sigma factor (sigma-70 family)
MTRDEIIQANIPVVQDMIKGFVGKNPNFAGAADDLEQVGMMKMIEAVDRLLGENRKIDAHFANYIRICIVTGVSDFVRNNETIRTPKNHWTPCWPLRRDPIIVDEEPPLTEQAVLGRLLDCVRDQKDAQIIQAKLRGHTTARDAANATGLSRSTVLRRLRKIRARYDKLK